MAAASELIGYPLLDAEEWLLTPTFDRVAYTDMVERTVFVGIDAEGRICAVIGIPLRHEFGAWLARQNLPLYEIYIADPLTIQSKLEEHESEFSAVADAVGLG